MSNPTKAKLHFEWIDTLRGISAIFIVLFHVRVDLWIGWSNIFSKSQNYSLFDKLSALLAIPTPFFGSAVMLFFLISGFCIHYPYAGFEREFSLKPYLIRRFLRIYPPYFAAVVVGIIVEIILQKIGLGMFSLKTAFLTIFMFQNFSHNSIQMFSNPSLWSLPVELELYLVYPLFYLILKKVNIFFAVLLVIVVSSISISLILVGQTWLMWHFLPYWLIWIAGALIAELLKSNRLPQWQSRYWFILVFFTLLSIYSEVFKSSSIINYLLSSLVYFMIIWRGLLSNPLKIMKNLNRVLISFGLISYSLYLIHFPFFRLTGAIYSKVFEHKPFNFIISLLFCFVSIVPALLMYKYVEKPSHFWAKKLSLLF